VPSLHYAIDASLTTPLFFVAIIERKKREKNCGFGGKFVVERCYIYGEVYFGKLVLRNISHVSKACCENPFMESSFCKSCFKI